MKKYFLLLTAVFAMNMAQAQIIVDASSLNYFQDFNTLDTSLTGAALSTNLPFGWSVYGWGGFGQAQTGYRAGNGSGGQAGSYSFGATTNTDRALGSLCSNNLPKVIYGVKFINNTGVTINHLVVSFRQEQWRAGYAHAADTTMDSTKLYYKVSANANDTNFNGWTEKPSLMLKTILVDSTPTNNLNGNAIYVVKMDTITVNVADGDSIALRFNDWNSYGNLADDGNAIDSFNVHFLTVSPPIPNYHPKVISKFPAANTVIFSPFTNNLKIGFNRQISKGTGNIRLKNVNNNTTQTFNVTSSNVTIVADTAIITGISLYYGNSYYVTFDSTAFDTAGYKSYGIYDSTAWDFYTVPAPHPNIISLFPVNNATNVPVNIPALRVKFNRQISAGTGNIILHNETDQTSQTIAATSSNIVIMGDSVFINGAVLNFGKTYHVTFDSTAFDTASFASFGIYDSLQWTFATMPPPPTSITEMFDSACANNTLPMGWSRVNYIGANQQWGCAPGGANPNKYMQMSGVQTGGSSDNDDWLITPPINLSASSNPMLYFNAYKRRQGQNIEVLASTNYTGVGSPYFATWTNLPVNFSNIDTIWNAFSAPLTTDNPLFIAFKYTCSSAFNDCSVWRVDSVIVTSTTGILTVNDYNQLPISVLGTASNSNILIGFSADKPALYTAEVFDLTGRLLYKKEMNAITGTNRMSLSTPSLPSGLYIIKVANGTMYGITKAVVE